MKTEFKLAGGKPAAKQILAVLFSVVLWCGMHDGFAQTIENATISSPGISPTSPGNSVNATISPGIPLPGTVEVYTYGGQTTLYDLNIDIEAGNYTSSNQTVTVLGFQNASGAVSVSNNGTITWENALSPAGPNIGSGALQAYGMPGGVSAQSDAYKFGSDVTVNNFGNITVSGLTSFSGGLPLQPPGFRTASLSGILAVSFGDQVQDDTTHSGGNVTVTSSNATISMSQADDDIITAGISATSANGPAEATGATYRTRTPPSVEVTLENADITNSANQAAGIIATNTGAQFVPGGDPTVGIGGNVTVALNGNSTISLTGQTGVGVFAISEVYTLNEAKNKPTAQAGTVNATVSSGSEISTGTSSSTLSIGVLGVSAGSDLFLDPYNDNAVNGFGAGDAGIVNVTNNGTISSNGTLSVGIAALSIGGASIATSNNSSQSFVGNSADTTAQGADTTVINNGSIHTSGVSAYGIVAMSSGGGGLVNNLIAASGNLTQIEGLVVGGNGSASGSGPGSNGGTISVTQNGSITTGNATSTGIIAQSIGGGGGNAGGNHPALFVGDKGGNGGDGGNVTVTTSAGSTLTTNGTNSLGILSQSIGGGGGNGGNAAGIFVAVGGKGGKGGAGGTVSGNFSGTLQSAADHSTTIMSQSVGGGGGHGGSAFALGEFLDASIGGKGATGGSGGSVSANMSETSFITSLGNNAAGVHLQSVGGGGGAGGHSYSGQYSAVIGVSIALGGNGGGGNNGGTVQSINLGLITTGVESTANATYSTANTVGADSAGLMGQSIGGGGGHGGGAIARSAVIGGADFDVPLAINFSFALGGTGGTGGAGGTVNLQNLNTITTYGDGSYGVLGQSVGGGGGNAGDSTAAGTLYSSESTQINMVVGVGGSGGTGGNGGEVSVVNNTADTTPPVISTFGQNAHAMLAQSIGGGGGIGAVGNARAGAPILPGGNGTGGNGTGGNGTGGNGTGGNGSSTSSFAFATGVGGSGGTAGDAGSVFVNNQGLVTTTGSTSYGILAQAVGGGGGLAAGGSANGDNNTISVDTSVGGKGGAAGNAYNDSNTGLSVNANNSGTISTKGGAAIGMVGQSIGGGGGIGGSADSKASVPLLGSIITPFKPSLGYSATIAVGGDGGAGGAGGSVSLSNFGGGNVTTEGDRAYGILGQSISGGGGIGGSAATGGNSAFLGTAQQVVTGISVGGSGGSAHNGGNVTIGNDVNSSVSTLGYGSHAMVAQSVSGGGGIGGDGTTDIHAVIGLGVGANKTGKTAGGGNGGNLSVTNNGTISTSNGDSVGILAQSVGGGGGMAHSGSKSHTTFNGTSSLLPIVISANLGTSYSNTTDVDGGLVNVSHGVAATTTTEGDWSHGIVAQSIGAGGGKASTISGTDTPVVANFTSSNVTISHTTNTINATTGNTTSTTTTTTLIAPDGLQLGATEGKGSGDTVNIYLSGNIATGSNSTGYSAYGVLAQSIGGGGGLATDNSPASTGIITLGGNSGSTSSPPKTGGNGGNVTVSGNTNLLTRGESAHGIVLQSIAGGGGLAGTGSSQDFLGNNTLAAHNIQLGGYNADGTASTANYTSTGGNVTTEGASAHAVIVQSIGGGGGIATADTGSNQAGGSITLGARAGINNNPFSGGEALITLGGGTTVRTSGDTSFGLVAQSIGAGGGIANTKQSGGTVTIGANLGNVSPDNFGGGQVQVSLASGSSVVTTGAGSHALIAQSIGGGGGIANADSSGGFTTQPTPGNPRQTHGYGSSVTVTNNATIQTSGAGAFGILAQSIGGGGGLSGSFAGSTGGSSSSGYSSNSSGNNGNVSVTTSGNITATGNGSVAIFAQNVTSGNSTVGNYGAGNVNVTVNAPLTVGGSGPGGVGVWVDGGHTNTLTVNSGAYLSAQNNAAIKYTGNNRLSVTNNGSVAGSVSLSDASSTRGTFQNNGSLLAQGIMNANITDVNSLTIGTDFNYASSATFTGNYSQSSGGGFYVDIYTTGAPDSGILNSGYDQMLFDEDGRGSFNGEMYVTFYNTYNAVVGDTFTLIDSAASGYSNTFAASFMSANVTGLGTGVLWETQVVSNSYQLIITAIPEPTTLTLALLALGAALTRARRRRVAASPR